MGTPNLDKILSLAQVRGYERTVRGREEFVRPHAEERFFHGTSHVLKPGTVLTAEEAARIRQATGGEAGSGPKKLYAVPSVKAASHYAHQSAVDRYEGTKIWGGDQEPDLTARPHVYEVEPVGKTSKEPTGHVAGAWRVKGEVPGDYTRHTHRPWEGK